MGKAAITDGLGLRFVLRKLAGGGREAALLETENETRCGGSEKKKRGMEKVTEE